MWPWVLCLIVFAFSPVIIGFVLRVDELQFQACWELTEYTTALAIVTGLILFSTYIMLK